MAPLLVYIRDRDERMLLYLVTRRHSPLVKVMRGLTHLGDAVVTVGIVLLLLLGAGARGDVGWTAAFVLVFSHALVQMLKRTIARPRPALPVGAALAEPPDRFSFPSGHAASSLSVALGATSLLPDALAGACLALAAVVGLSRCYLGVHYPGDVVCGWILALISFAVAGLLGI